MQHSDLQSIANQLRVDVLSLAGRCDFGVHLAGPLSSAECLAVLYFAGLLNHDFDSAKRDRVVLSCGHYAPILYACFLRLGIITKEKFDSFGKMGGLAVHPELVIGAQNVPGVEASTGPLAQGMSVAVGRAMAMKRSKNSGKIYCVCSDGEMQEGQAWEAVSLSVREGLDNLVWLIDNNNVQIEHYVTELSGKMPLVGKFEAFGCHTLEIDGHDTAKIEKAIVLAKGVKGAPTAIILKTVGGKGVSFMENNPKWHDGRLSDEQFEKAMKGLLRVYV